MSDRKKLKVAVLGLGYFSQFHLNSWGKLGDVSLVGVCDLDEACVLERSSEYSVEGFSDFEKMLEETDPDIVDLIVPPVAHVSAIRQAFKPGRVVICQKPFCLNLEEAKAITAEAEERDCTLIVHENFRFQPWYRTIKSFLSADGLGQIYQATFSLRPGDGRGADAYLARQPSFQAMEKFLVHETAIHFVDLHRWLFGEIETVYADLRQLNPAIAGEDAGFVMFSHHNGTRTVFDGNRLSDHPAENPRKTMGEMRIEGEKGTLQLNGYGEIWFREFTSSEWSLIPIEAEIDEGGFGGGCVHALNLHVIQNFKTREFENVAKNYLRNLEIENAIYSSAELGRKITV